MKQWCLRSLFRFVTVFSLCCGRNDVWRYQQFPGYTQAIGRLFFRGFGLASLLMVFTIAADKMFGLKRDLHRHHHSDEHSMHDWQLCCYVTCIVVAVSFSLKIVCCSDLCKLRLVEKRVVGLAEKLVNICDVWLSGSLIFQEFKLCRTLISISCCKIKQVNTWIFVIILFIAQYIQSVWQRE